MSSVLSRIHLWHDIPKSGGMHTLKKKNCHSRHNILSWAFAYKLIKNQFWYCRVTTSGYSYTKLIDWTPPPPHVEVTLNKIISNVIGKTYRWYLSRSPDVKYKYATECPLYVSLRWLIWYIVLFGLLFKIYTHAYNISFQNGHQWPPGVILKYIVDITATCVGPHRNILPNISLIAITVFEVNASARYLAPILKHCKPMADRKKTPPLLKIWEKMSR